MCGILGKINFKKENNWDGKRFLYSLNLMEHRGPDDYGIFKKNEFIFGHRRLSIIDLKKSGHQPMLSNDKSVVIVFNGEIYNYLEIKKDLKQKKYKFSSKSDTEVILNAYLCYGIKCLDKFIGMFSIAIFDTRKKKSYIIRDRLGIKPLYYLYKNESLTFSSEVKSILSINNLKKKLNINAVSSYLSFRYPILDDTFFEGINSIPPAHYIEFSKYKFKIKCYWDAKSKINLQKNDKGERFYINEIKKLLNSSVKYRMISDVPFGSYLSGGVDSSVITGIMDYHSKDPVKTYTIGFKENKFNEFKYSDAVANRFSTDHKKILLSQKNYIKELEKLIEIKDAPLSVPNEVPLYLMSKELKKDITVVLSGEGADEIFFGYGRIFRSTYDYERYKYPSCHFKNSIDIEKFQKKILNKYKKKDLTNELNHFLCNYEYTSHDDKNNLLSKKINIKKIDKKLKKKFIGIFKSLKNFSYENKIMYIFTKIHLPGLLLRLDNSTMAASVEGRVPFVDHRLVELAFSIPTKYKLKWKSKNDKIIANKFLSEEISEKYDIPKYILKKSYEDLLPNKILYRKKIGFPVPLSKWSNNLYKKELEKNLLSSKAKKRGIYNEKYLKELFKDLSIITTKQSIQLWMLLNLELFCQKNFD